MNAAQRAAAIREQRDNTLAELRAEVKQQAANEAAGKPFTFRHALTLSNKLDPPHASPGGVEVA